MTDLIDRQMAIEAIDNHIFYDDYDSMDKISLINAIRVLPSVKKRGRWIAMSDADGIYWACSECGEDIPRISHYDPQFDLFPRLESIDRTNYCPTCGARMEKNNG